MTDSENSSLVREVQETKGVIIDALKDNKLTLVEFVDVTVTLALFVSHLLIRFKNPAKNTLTNLSRENSKTKRYIENILREMLAVSSCHRVILNIFENGTRIGSIHFKKMTALYEVDATGVRFISPFIQKKEISPELEEEILHFDKPSFTKYSVDYKKDSQYTQYLDSIGVNTVYTKLLSNKKGPYALLELQFIDVPDYELLDNEDKLNSLQKGFNKLLTTLDKITKI